MKGKFYSVFVLFMLASVALFAQPKIASFSPASGDVGTTVTINGSNFNTTPASNWVRFGAVQASVLTATASKLTVTVPVGASFGPVSVTNVATGLSGASSSFFIPTFSPKNSRIQDTDFNTKPILNVLNGRAKAVAVSDANSDGKPDVLAVGGYSTATSYLLYAVTNKTAAGVTSFTKDSFSLGSKVTPISMAAGDLDGDNKPDVVAVHFNSAILTLFRNTTTTAGGTIKFATKTNITLANTADVVALIDMDGDGKKDLVTTSSFAGYVSVMLNTSTVGNISFGAEKTFATGSSPENLDCGDLDGDGKWDIVTANRKGRTISVLLNKSTGSGNVNFATKIDYPTAQGLVGVSIADIDVDGKLDIVSSSDTTSFFSCISIFRNQSTVGNISFAAKYDYNVGNDMNFTGFGDFDGDGKIDLAVNSYIVNGFAYYGASIIRNISTPGNITFMKAIKLGGYGYTNKVGFVGDITLDGKPDIINYGNDIVYYFENNSTLSGNANLDSLTVTGGTLSPSTPDFTKVSNFFVNIPYDSASFQVYADVVDTGYASLSVQVNGKGFTAMTAKTYSRVNLDPDTNYVQIKVTAENGTEKIYTITAVRVLRPQILSTNNVSGTIGSLIALKGKNLSVNPSASINGVNAVIVNYTDTTMTLMVMPTTTSGKIKVNTISGSYTFGDVFVVTSTTYPSQLEGAKNTTGGGTGAYLGNAVALSADGNTGVYGAYAAASGIGTNAVSTRTGGAWSSITFYGSSRNVGNSRQGTAVAVSADGNTFISGAPADNKGLGAAFIFEKKNGYYQEKGKLIGTGYTTLSSTVEMGSSVAISADGNTVAFGGPNDSYGDGLVWLYNKVDSSYKQQAVLKAFTSGAHFGSSLSFSADGNTLLVGAEGVNSYIGSAYVYVRSGTTWTLQRQLTGTGYIGLTVYQGASVSLSADGNTALIGGYRDSTGRGACWLFKRTGKSWNQDGDKIVNNLGSSKGQFGYSVSLNADGNIAMIGSLNTLSNGGSAYVYKRVNGKMLQQSSGLPNTGLVGFTDTYFGSAVAISADGINAVVGASGDNSNTGAVWHYVANISNTYTLSNLTTSTGSISPAFNASTFNYTLNVGSTTDITVTPTLTDTTATLLVSINSGALSPVVSGSPSATLPLTVGTNTITISVTSQAGSTNIYTITVNRDCPKDTTTTVKNVCTAALPYTWNGSSYNSGGTYYKTLTGTTGCDSVLVLQLNIVNITPTTATANLTGCRSLVYNGINYTTSTSIIDTVKTNDGCDSVYKTVNITILNFTTKIFIKSANGCNSVVYKGITYTASTVLRDTIRSVYGCDSVINVDRITVGYSSSSSATVVANVSYTWNGTVYTNSGTYTKTLAGANSTGCDSTITLILTIIPKGCWSKVNAGATHTLAIKGDGTLWAWGANSFGQLGNGSSVASKVPAQVGTDTNWASVSGGNNFSAAIKTNGTLWIWGYNADGQIGDGTTVNKPVPKQVGTATNWASVTTGEGHVVAIKTDGSLWAWGFNAYGQIGDGTITINTPTPTQIGTAKDWKAVSVKGNFTLALKTNGTLWAWGRNNNYQLGDGTNVNKSAPVQIGTDNDWANIAAGYDHSVALKSDGTLWTWGLNNFNQLGDGTTNAKSAPSQVGNKTNWKSIAAGFNHSLAVQTDGTLWSWGYNLQGQLGNGTTVNGSTPTKVGTTTGWLSLGAGNVFSTATLDEGSTWSWGNNLYYQLGDGTSVNKSVPTLIGVCTGCGAIKPTTSTTNVTGCGSVIYQSVVYKASTVLNDTIRTSGGCDSVYKVINITVSTGPVRDTSATTCSSFNWNGINYTKDTVVTRIVTNTVSATLTEGFSGTTTVTAPAGWTFSSSLTTYQTAGNFGAASPSLKFAATNDQITTPTLPAPATQLSFWLKNQGATGSSLKIEGYNGSAWVTVNSLTTFPSTGTTIQYNPTSTPQLPTGLNRFRFTYTKTTGNLAFDDVSIVYSGSSGCDSSIVLHLTVTTPQTVANSVSGCGSVVYKGTTYTNNTILKDTIKSVGGCDSLYNQTNIVVLPYIAGSIKHPTAGAIANVTATLTNGAITSSKLTSGGNYQFDCLSADSGYTIRPSKNNDVIKSNGISTIDLLFIQSHILGKVVLNSPYKVIAADVNNSGDVTTIDLLLLKRVILTIDTSFTGKRLWAFVDSSYSFPNPLKPFPYKDSIRITNPSSNAVEQSFVGVKLGDVNYDWNPATLGVRKESQPLVLEYQPIAATAQSSQIRIPIKVNRFDQLLGLQFTLHFDASEYSFARIDNNMLQLDYGTNHSSEGAITFLWTDKQLQPITLADGTTILELVLNKRNGGTATPPVLQISSSHTPIEAWDEKYSQHNILLKTTNAITEAETTLDSYTLSPNPADADVFLTLKVSSSKTVRVTVSNAAGQKVKELSINATKGQSIHALPLRGDKGLAAGMYYVDVQGMDSRSVKKLLIR